MATVTKRGRYWRAQIRRLGFPPQHKSFDTHVEADAWARVVESEMDRGIFASRVEAERTTLAKALERYKTDICSCERLSGSAVFWLSGRGSSVWALRIAQPCVPGRPAGRPDTQQAQAGVD